MRVLRTLVVASTCTAIALMLCASTASAQVTMDHLKCYQIKDVKGDKYTHDLSVEHQDLVGANANDTNCTLKRSASFLCVVAGTENMSPEPSNEAAYDAASIPDSFDYACYKITCDRNSQPVKGTEITLEDRFGSRTVRVKRARQLCVPIIDKQPF
jgi:hypothetical protein